MTESFAQLFEESLASQKIKPGAILTGRVVEVGPDVVLVNAGLKSEAVIPAEQFRNERGEMEVAVGDDVEVALDSVEDGNGETRLSREKAKRARTWSRLEQAFEKQEIVKGIINGRVKGGFTVEIDFVRAFLPGSLVDVRPVRDPSYLEGKTLEFKVIKLDQKRNNVVVSRRAVVEQEYSAERTELLEKLQEGAHVVELDRETALDATRDDTGHDLGLIECLFESRPGARPLGLLARQARLARAVLDGIEGDLDDVADGDLELTTLVIELIGGNDGLGLEARIHEHDFRPHVDDGGTQDRTRFDTQLGETLLEQLGKAFCHGS